MVDVAQLTEPVHRWFVRQRGHSETLPSSPLPEGVRISRRKDHQVAACVRLSGLVTKESGYPTPPPASQREWLTGPDLLDAWVAEGHGSVQGHVAITRVDTDPVAALRWQEVTGRPASELAGISCFFVRAGLRGKGLGHALLETAVAEARVRRLLPVAQIISTSRQGVPLYDHAGWRMAAMYPYGTRGERFEHYLYVAPSGGLPPRTYDEA